ncbi:MAG: DUF4870 domain-containing protein [Phycisphaerae bacterium]|nr:DUF4870 domain-containing protein [Phycisphaerae bacterium]
MDEEHPMHAAYAPGDFHPEAAGGAGPHGRFVDPAATPDERTWAVGMHITHLANHFFVPVVLVLVLWLIKRNDSPFIEDHGKEALNFQISLLIYSLLGIPVAFVTLGLGAIIWYPAIVILGLVGMIRAMIAANRGEYYRYPMCLRLVK